MAYELRKTEKRAARNDLLRLMLPLALAIASGFFLSACSRSDNAALKTANDAAKASPTSDSNKENGAATSANVSAKEKTTESAAVAAQVVVSENFAFKPAKLVVAPGAKVTWINKDDAPHTATSVNERFNSGALDTNDSFSFVFKEKGDYPYLCKLHPQMKGLITVK